MGLINRPSSGTCQICGKRYQLIENRRLMMHYWVKGASEVGMGARALRGVANMCLGAEELPAELDNSVAIEKIESMRLILSTAMQTGITSDEQAEAARIFDNLNEYSKKIGEPITFFLTEAHMFEQLGPGHCRITPKKEPIRKASIRPSDPNYKYQAKENQYTGRKIVNTSAGAWEWSSLNISNPIEERMIRESLDLGRSVLLEEYE